MKLHASIARAVGAGVIAGIVTLAPAAAGAATTGTTDQPAPVVTVDLGHGSLLGLDTGPTTTPTVPTTPVTAAAPGDTAVTGPITTTGDVSTGDSSVRVQSHTSSDDSADHRASVDVPVDVCVSTAILTGGDPDGCGAASTGAISPTPASLDDALASLGSCVLSLGAEATDACGIPSTGTPLVPVAVDPAGTGAGEGAPSVDTATIGEVVHDAGLCPTVTRLGLELDACASDTSTPTTPNPTIPAEPGTVDPGAVDPAGDHAGGGHADATVDSDGSAAVNASVSTDPGDTVARCVGLAVLIGADAARCGAGSAADGSVAPSTGAGTTPLDARCADPASSTSALVPSDELSLVLLGSLGAVLAFLAGRIRRRVTTADGPSTD